MSKYPNHTGAALYIITSHAFFTQHDAGLHIKQIQADPGRVNALLRYGEHILLRYLCFSRLRVQPMRRREKRAIRREGKGRSRQGHMLRIGYEYYKKIKSL